MYSESEKVLAKVQKLLARANDERNDSDNERETAMRQANALLAKHGLSMAEMDAFEEKETFGPKGKLEIKDYGRAVWKRIVLNQIAKLNGCMVITSTKWDYDGDRPRRVKMIYVIGRAVRATVTRQMADYVIESIEREGKRVRRNEYPSVNGRTFMTNFGTGASQGVARQVKDILAAQREGQIGDQQVSRDQALVVVNQHRQAMEEAMATIKQLFGKTRSSSYYGGQGSGSAEGRAYGKSINLNGQIGTSRGQRRLGNG
jgi:hypothetical protein